MKTITSLLLFVFTFLSYSQEPNQDQLKWLKKQIHPITNINNPNDAGVNWFYKQVKNTKIIGLGEFSHGSHENFIIKNKLFQYLNKKDSTFNVYALESNMAKGVLINNFLHTNTQKSAEDVLEKSTHNIFKSEEFVNLLNWMKASKTVNFYGFDMQYFQQSIIALQEHLNSPYQHQLINEVAIILKKHFDKIFTLKTNIPLSKKDKKLVLNHLKRLQTSCDKQAPYYNWTQQHINLLKQYTILNTMLLRDKFMADNVLWIHKQHPTSKIIVSGHNLHLQKNKYLGFKQGYYLSKTLKNNYISVGFIVYDGRISAKTNKLRKMTTASLEQPPKDSYEYILNSLNEPLFILDLKDIKAQQNSFSKWFLKNRLHREVGAVIAKNNFRYADLYKLFDMIVFIKTSTPSKVFSSN